MPQGFAAITVETQLLQSYFERSRRSLARVRESRVQTCLYSFLNSRVSKRRDNC